MGKNLIYNEMLLLKTLSQSDNKTFFFMTDIESRITVWSESVIEMFGLETNVMYGDIDEWKERIHPDDINKFERDMHDLQTHKKERYNSDYRILNKDNEYIWVSCKAHMSFDDDNQPIFFAGFVQALSKRVKIDNATSLWTEFVFRGDLDYLIKHQADGISLLVSIIDFKYINDTYGYAFGDRVLQTIGASLLSELHSDNSIECKIYRMNGADFAITICGSSEAYVEVIIDKLHRILRYLVIDNEKISLEAYIAATSFPKDGYTVDIIQSNLFYALDYAKKNKIKTLTWFDSSIYSKNSRNSDIKKILRNSIDNNFEGFRLVFQPIVETLSKKCVSAEALLRFECEKLGQLSPVEFIPILEDEGYIIEVGKWIIDQCMNTLNKWNNMNVTNRLQTLHINVSYLQFKEASLGDYVTSKIEEYGLENNSITLELTESCRVQDMTELEDILGSFHRYGIGLALDDFGTGYASLIVLRSIPADIVKIDHTLIRTITSTVKDRALIEIIIEFCKKAGIKVCTEGVENQEIYDIVKNAGADFIQGYHIDKPLEKEEFFDKYLK